MSYTTRTITMVENRYFKFLWIIVIITGLWSCNATKHVPEKRQLLVKNIIVSTDKSLNTEPIYSYLKQKENSKTAMFFNFHLWIYNLSLSKNNKAQKVQKWLGIKKMGEIIGEPPVLMDSTLNDVSLNQIKQYMQNRGYYHSNVSDSIKIYGRKKNKAKVYYIISPNQRLLIDTVTYKIQDSTIAKIIFDDKPNRKIDALKPVDVDIFQIERERITELLKNNGYFNFTKEYIYYQIDTGLNINRANVEIRIVNPDSQVHKQYKINDIYYINDFEAQEYLRQKDQYYDKFDTTQYKKDFFLNRKKPMIRAKTLSNSSYLYQGALYSAYNVQTTYRRLSSFNEFELVNIRYNELPDTSKLDVIIQLSPLKKKNYITELEGTNSSGNFGIGGRLSFQHRSLFRGAEILNAQIYGKIESQNSLAANKDDLNFNSQEIGGSVSLSFPKFLVPFKTEQFIKKNNPRTSVEFNINYKDRPEYERSVTGGSFGYFWVSQNFFRHQFRLADVSAVKVFNMDDDYYSTIENTYLEKSFEDYLISASNYTLYFTNENERKGQSFFTIIMGAEVAGNTYYAISKVFNFEPIDGQYQMFNNIYAQYWKTEFDIRYNQKISKTSKLIYRIYSGMAKPYGNVDAMPYVKQFFSGGANGLRAWPVKSIGPGSYYNPDRKYYNEAADLKFEGNIESRLKLFSIIEGAWFLDAGNIWALSTEDPRSGALFEASDFISEIGVGSGLGLRFDFSFLVFRIDYGIKIRDPKEPVNERWVIAKHDYSPFKSNYSMFNFGIGYPF